MLYNCMCIILCLLNNNYNSNNLYKSKPLHGYFFTVCNPITDTDISFHWLKSGDLHTETESMLVAAQDHALSTRSIQHLYDERCSSVCRLYREQSKTVEHIICGCKFLAATQYI